jgi:hypothetical protein
LPEPEVDVLNVTHDAEFCVVHEQASPAVTAIVPLPPAASIDAMIGEML